jgi:hypothetical protein
MVKPKYSVAVNTRKALRMDSVVDKGTANQVVLNVEADK